MKDLIPQDERDRIEQAVAQVELRTSGEIVPYIVGRSDRYRETGWKASVIFGATSVLLIYIMYLFYHGWSYAWLFTLGGSTSLILASSALGWVLATFIPGFERLLVSDRARSAAVHRRAMQAFVEEEVFATRDRTGILLYVSLFEHRVEVFGDSGINARVQPEDWAHVVEDVLLGIKSGSLGQGMAAAIDRCGDLLVENGFDVRPDDTDELDNSLRLRAE